MPANYYEMPTPPDVSDFDLDGDGKLKGAEKTAYNKALSAYRKALTEWKKVQKQAEKEGGKTDRTNSRQETKAAGYEATGSYDTQWSGLAGSAWGDVLDLAGDVDWAGALADGKLTKEDLKYLNAGRPRGGSGDRPAPSGGSDVISSATEWIKENPIPAAGIGLAGGYLIYKATKR